jgi:DNA-binding NarL/FixJ family response regulator
MHTMVIANRHEIAGAGMESLLQAGGHRVVARCSREGDLLHVAEAYRPDIVMLAKNMSAGTPRNDLASPGTHCSVAIVLLLEERRDHGCGSAGPDVEDFC